MRYAWNRTGFHRRRRWQGPPRQTYLPIDTQLDSLGQENLSITDLPLFWTSGGVSLHDIGHTYPPTFAQKLK